MAKRRNFEYQPPTGPSENRGSMSVFDEDLDAPLSAGSVPNVVPALFGLVFIVAGAFPFGVATNLINIPGSTVHCPLFVLGSVGLAFMGAGSIVFCNGVGLSRFPRFMGILGLVTIMSFLTPFGWLAIFAPKVELIARIFIGFFVGVIGLAIVIGFARTVFFGPAAQVQSAFKGMFRNPNDQYPPG